MVVYQSLPWRSNNDSLGVTSRVNMNTFVVYGVRPKTHILVLSGGFCRRVID